MSTQDINFFYHPIWAINRPFWQPATDLFDGDLNTLRTEAYLTRFEVEKIGTDGTKAYTQRANRTYYSNYYRAIAHILCAYIFQEEIDLEPLKNDQLFDESELKNFDGNGTSFIDFLKNIFYQAATTGTLYISIDSPPMPEGASAQQKESQKIRPFASLWNPLQVVDWIDFDEPGENYGKPRILQREFIRTASRSQITDQPKLERVRYHMEATQAGYLLRVYRARNFSQIVAKTPDARINADGTVTTINSSQWEQIGNDRLAPGIKNEIPVIRSIQEPWLKDAMSKAWHLYQIESSLDNILHYQAYTRPFIAGSLADPGGKEIQSGESSIIWLSQGSQVFDVKSENCSAIMARMTDVRNSLFRIGLYQLRQLNASSNQTQSADNQREEKANTFSYTKNKIQELQDTIDQTISMWAMFKEKEVEPGLINIIREPESYNLSEFLEIYQATLSLQEDNPEIQKTLVKELLSFVNLDKDEKERAINTLQAAKRVDENLNREKGNADPAAS